MKTLLALWCVLPAAFQDPALEPGLVAEYFDFPGGISNFPDLKPGQRPDLVRIEKQVNHPDTEGDFAGSRFVSNYYARWTGILRVEKAAVYTLYTESDDGSRVTIDGKVVVDNGGIHAMQEKNGHVELSAGDHELRIEYFQGGGGAGVTVKWQPAGLAREILPAKALFHKKSAVTAYDEAAWKKRPALQTQAGGPKKGGGKYALMDHGPFASGTIDVLWGGKGNFAHKGFAITLDKEKQAHVCFDSEQLRMAGAWTGGPVGWPAGRDGIEGQPFADGVVSWGTHKGSLGFARGNTDWKDPRAKPYGPLPQVWGRWRGLYLHGDRVVLSYLLGVAEILELPAFDAKADVFTRTFNVEHSLGPPKLLLAEKNGAPASLEGELAVLDLGESVVAAGASGATLSVQGSRLEADLPRGRSSLFLWSGPRSGLPKFVTWLKSAPAPADLTPLTKGGPGRNTPVAVSGTLGAEAGGFQVDTIPVPYENPSKSYMRLTGVDFFADGKRAAVCTMDGDVWLVTGIDATLATVTWKRFASGLFQALGLRIVDDKVHVLGRDQITRFHDFNGDGEADFYENFNNDCGVTVAYHEFAHDLHTDSQGNFYYAKGSTMGGAVVPYHGTVVKVSKDGLSSEVHATGFRAPNGMSVGPGDVVTTSDNQGNWIPTTPINYITKRGQFCGFQPCSHQSTTSKEQPQTLCWIPYSADNSGGGQVWCTSDAWGPFKGQLFHFSYGKCALFYILREPLGGDEWQGGSIRLPFKFLSGAMRGRFNPVDGQLYLVGMRGWQTDAAKDGCFQRVRSTGKPANLPLSAKVSAGQLALTFTDKLDPETAGSLDSYVAQWANLRYTGNYGSDEYWVSEPNKKGREPLAIQAATLSEDGRTVTLKIDGLKPVYYVVLKYKIRSAEGAAMNQELYYTINRVP